MARSNRGVTVPWIVQKKVKVGSGADAKRTTISLDPSLVVALDLLGHDPDGAIQGIAEGIAADDRRSVSRAVQAGIVRLLLDHAGVPAEQFDQAMQRRRDAFGQDRRDALKRKRGDRARAKAVARAEIARFLLVTDTASATSAIEDMIYQDEKVDRHLRLENFVPTTTVFGLTLNELLPIAESFHDVLNDIDDLDYELAQAEDDETVDLAPIVETGRQVRNAAEAAAARLAELEAHPDSYAGVGLELVGRMRRTRDEGRILLDQVRQRFAAVRRARENAG